MTDEEVVTLYRMTLEAAGVQSLKEWRMPDQCLQEEGDREGVLTLYSEGIDLGYFELNDYENAVSVHLNCLRKPFVFESTSWKLVEGT